MDPKGSEAVEGVDVTMMQNSAAQGGSAADVTGWNITVSYTKAPEISLFTATYPDEATAKKVMDDLSLLAAEAEGAIKEQNWEKAKEKSQQFLSTNKANSGSQPSPEQTPD